MAWLCSGGSNVDLVKNLVHGNVVKSDIVAAAMRQVDRGNYVLSKSEAYLDSPQIWCYHIRTSYACTRSRNSSPFPPAGARVLDIGSGSGYLSAVFHHLVSSEQQKGKVVGIEHIPQLVEWSIKNLGKDGLQHALDDNEIVMLAGDGRLGYPDGGPYDAIHVGAAAPVLPQLLVDQLTRPGRMFIPVGEYMQDVVQVDKHEDGRITSKRLFGVMYVPLTDREKQTM